MSQCSEVSRSGGGPSGENSVRRGVAALVLAAALSVWLAGPGRAAEDPDDAKYVAGRLQDVLEYEKTGREVVWANPTTKKSGIIKIERTFYKDSNTPCRDYVRTQDLGEGLALEVRGTGCRLGDGRWFLDEKAPAVTGAPAPPSAGSSSAGTTTGPTPSSSASGATPPQPGGSKIKTAAPKATPEAKAEPPAPKSAAVGPGPAEELSPATTSSEKAAKAAGAKAKAPPLPQKRPPKPQFTFSLPNRTAL